MKPVIFSIILCACLSTQSPAAMIVVPVTITYQGRAVQADMAVDTGSTITTISSALADRLQVSRTTGRGMVEVADGRAVPYVSARMDVSAGGMTRNDIRVNIMDYAGVRAVDGWLGVNFLDGFIMTIDWKGKQIYWSEP